jgi:hypothetical protein
MKSIKVTKKVRAQALTKAINENPPKLRLTCGVRKGLLRDMNALCEHPSCEACHKVRIAREKK